MGQYEVDFNIESFGNDENDIQYLKTAIDNLTNESEKQFQTIKNEKWFTRIIDLATLSNKKDIRMSQQISNIAQAQDILIELLKRLSATDVKIDNMLLNSMNQIEQLYNHTEKLALKVVDLKEQMIYGINQSKNINDLKDIEKTVLYNLLQEASKTFENTTIEQQQFADNLFRYLQLEHSTVNLPESINQLDSIAIKKVLLQLLLEYGFLNSNNFIFNSEFQEIVEMFDFGNRTINEIKDTIQNIYQLRGVEGFSWFNPAILEHEFFIDLEIEEYLEQESENFIEREPLSLEQIIVIDQDENEVIKNKIINLSSIVTVKGKLQFDNCEINIMNNFVPINLEKGILEFIDCEINANSDKDSIIIKSEYNSKLNIYSSSIKSTIPLYKATVGDVTINNSFIDSENQGLLHCKNITILDSKVINSKKNKLIKHEDLRDFIYCDEGSIKIENSVFQNLKNLFFGTYNVEYIIESSMFEDSCDLGNLFYMMESTGSITNTFINQVGKPLSLSNVEIENCEIRGGGYSNYFSLELENCKIQNLKLDNLDTVHFNSCSIKNLKATNIDNIKLYENNEFIESVFDKCYFDTIIYQGNKFYNSTFANADNKKSESFFHKSGYLEFTVSKSDYKETKIEGCLFENINIEDGYIINLNCHEKIKYKRHEISKCIFKECSSNKSSFINLESFYFPKLSKKRKDIVLGIERDNVGLENVKR
ncbi:hypothetical protein NGC02_01535 [Mammaliicoccus sciuri]|uniref:hypothetical protein n=1 Tax=Mammaliicoccus sciuri TaxID=1296 RepID=UPI002DBAA903|nr:hypothetical protein [Mammaliicoccus sciuri]MEB7400192.1 hypothetical protein [Mammaliicoccus sciuri]